MEGFETMVYKDKAQRDARFQYLRHSDFANERQVIKYSDPEPMMVSEEEFRLDAKDRVMYQTKFFLAYPEDIHGHRVRRRERDGQ